MFAFGRRAPSRHSISSTMTEDDDSIDSNSASDALLKDERPQNFEPQQKPHFPSSHPIMIHSFIFVLYIALGTLVVRMLNPKCHCDLLYCKTSPKSELIPLHLAQLSLGAPDERTAPAQEAAAQPVVVTFDNPHNATSVFRGQPREELHDAWSGLLQYHNIRVQEPDLHKINRTSLPLNDEGGGYLVTLDVFHQIHCLNQVRQQIYHEYYYPEIWNSSERFMHADHCIDLLRQVLMCRGDLSLLTYSWIDGYRRPWPEYSVAHTCHNWDNVMHWASENYIPSLKGPILMHPTLGPAWPKDDDESLG